MARVSIGLAYDPVEVDFFGSLFETVDLTRSASKKATALSLKLGEIADDDPDKAIELIGQIFDLKLVAADGKGKSSTILMREWKADKVSIRGVLRFLADLGKAEAGEFEDLVEATNGRPT